MDFAADPYLNEINLTMRTHWSKLEVILLCLLPGLTLLAFLGLGIKMWSIIREIAEIQRNDGPYESHQLQLLPPISSVSTASAQSLWVEEIMQKTRHMV